MAIHKFNYIEISRGIAAILVVMHHATLDANDFYHSVAFHNLFYFGMAGVDFFFVLSGFIIFYVHSNDALSFKGIKKYLLKRIIRVYPAFLLISFTMLIAFISFPYLSNRININNLEYILKSFLLFPLETTPILTVSWTLVHEMFFYFLFFIFILNKKIGTIIFVVWGILIFVMNLYFEKLVFPLSFYFSIYNLEFLIGILVAIIVKKYNFQAQNIFKYKFIFFFSLFLFFMNGLNVNYHWIMINSIVVKLIYGISSALIILGLIFLEDNRNKNLVFKFLLLIGTASYSIYLIHRPLQSVIHRIIDKINLEKIIDSDIIFSIVVFISVLTGVIFYKFVEEPMLKYLKNKFL